MPRQVPPIPKTSDQIINDTIKPYPLLGDGNPNVNPVNRGNDVSVRGDVVRDININLTDLSEAVRYYIINTIKPVVYEGGDQINVPVEFVYGERWNEAQKNGFLRDKAGRVLLPLIIIKRDSIVRNRALGNKLDGNRVHNYQSFATQYTKKNQYDNFSVLTNRIPVKQYHITPVPDYVIVTFNVSIITNTQEQSDDLIQAFNFAADAYWGELDRFKFKVNIESFTDSITYSQGEDRTVRSNFNVILNGYLLPESVNRDLASKKKILSKAVIKFNFDIVPKVDVGTNISLLTNDLLINDNNYIIDSNGNRLNIGSQTQLDEFVNSDGSYFVNSNGSRFQIK